MIGSSLLLDYSFEFLMLALLLIAATMLLGTFAYALHRISNRAQRSHAQRRTQIRVSED